MRIVLLLTFLVAVSGCATQQQSLSSGTAGQSTHADISKCAVRVGFSGPPRQLGTSELAPHLSPLPKYWTWTAEGWLFDQIRLTESATCICRDYPFTSMEREQFAANMRAMSKVKNVRENESPVGQTVEFQSTDGTPSAMETGRNVFPTGAPSCFFVQAIRTPEFSATAASALFFSRLTPATQNIPASAQARPGLPAADRLKQLDKLLEDRLTTRQEYVERRKVILGEL